MSNIKHAKTSGKADGGDATLVQPSDWNAEHVVDTQLEFPIATPVTPPADTFALFGRSVGGRSMPAFIGPSGLDSSLQPLLARNKVGFWNPPGNSTTVPGVFGLPAVGATGTATSRTVATTNIATRTRRLGYVSVATVGGLAGARTGSGMFTTGTGAGLGGFQVVLRWVCSDAATVAGARGFFGVSASLAAPTNVEPSTLTNCLGVAQLSTDATQWYLVYGGSAAQTAVALGTALGAPNNNTILWDLALFASPNLNGVISYQVTNVGTGVSATGTITPGTPGLQTPANTSLLNVQMWRTNNATALAVAVDVSSIYIETDQ